MTSCRPSGTGAGTAAMAASIIEPHIPVSFPWVFFTIEVRTSTTGPFELSSPHNFNHFLRAMCLCTASERVGFCFPGVSVGASVGVAAAVLALAAIDAMSIAARGVASRDRSARVRQGGKRARFALYLIMYLMLWHKDKLKSCSA